MSFPKRLLLLAVVCSASNSLFAQTDSPSASIPADTGIIEIDCPADAKTFVNGAEYSERRLIVKPLAADELYVYDLKAVSSDGREEQRRVLMRGGWLAKVSLLSIVDSSMELLLPIWPLQGSGAINLLALSADGKLGAGGNGAGNVVLWNLETGKVVRTWHTGKESVSALAFAPDGQSVAVARYDRDIVILDVVTGAERHQIGVKNWRQSLAFHPSGRWLACVDGNAVAAFDVQTGEELFRLRGHSNDIVRIAFTADGKRLVCGLRQYEDFSELVVWNVDRKEQERRIRAPLGLAALAISPDGVRIAAAGGSDKSPGWLSLWDADNGTLVRDIRGWKVPVRAISFHPSAPALLRVASQWSDGKYKSEIALWDYSAASSEPKTEAFSESFEGAAFSADGRRLFLPMNQGLYHAVLRDVETDRVLHDLRPAWSAVTAWDAHDQTGKLLVAKRSKSDSKSPASPVVIDVATGSEGRQFVHPKGAACSSARFSPDGSLLAASYSGDADTGLPAQLIVWNVADATVRTSIDIDATGVYLKGWDVAGQRILTLESTKVGDKYQYAFRLWDLSNRRVAFTFLSEYPRSSEFSPDGRFALASIDEVRDGQSRGTIIVWDAKTGSEIRRIRYDKTIDNIAVSYDSRRLLAGAYQSCGVWDLQSGAMLHDISGLSSSVYAFPLPGFTKHFLLNDNGTVCVLDAETGALLANFDDAEVAYSYSLSAFGGGRYLVLRTYQTKDVGAWDLATGERLASWMQTPDGVAAISSSGLIEGPDSLRDSLERRLGDGLEAVPIGESWSKLKRPSLIGELLSGKRPRPEGAAVDSSAPLVRILAPPPNANLQEKAVVIEVEAKDNGAGIRGPWLWHGASRIVEAVDSPTEKGAVRKRFSISLRPGPNRIEAHAADKAGKSFATPVVASLDYQPASSDAAPENRPQLVLQTGHSDSVQQLAVSPDGRWLITGSADKSAILWEVSSGRQRKTLVEQMGSIECIAVAPDNRRAVISGERTKLIDIDTGRALRQFPAAAEAIAFSLDGRTIIAVSSGAVYWWDVATGKQSRKLSIPYFSEAVISPDGRYVALETFRKEDGKDDYYHGVKLVETATGNTRDLQEYLSSIESLAFSPDGRRIAVGFQGTDDRAPIVIFDVGAGTVVRNLVDGGHRSYVVALSWSPDGKHLLSGSWDSQCILWNVESGRAERTFVAEPNKYVRAVVILPDGRRAVSGLENSKAVMWNLDSMTAERTFRGYSDPIVSVAASADGRIVACGSERSIVVWDTTTGQARTVVALENGRTFGMDGEARWLFTQGADDESISSVWDAATGQMLTSLREEENEYSSEHILAAPDGGSGVFVRYFYDDDDKARTNIVAWDRQSGQRLRRMTQSSTCSVAAISRTGRWLAVGGDRKSGDKYEHDTVIWDLAAGSRLRTLAPAEESRAAAFHPEERKLFLNSLNGVEEWDIATGSRLRSFAMTGDYCRSIAASPDGALLAIGSNTGRLYLFDLATGQQLRQWDGHSDEVRSIAFLGGAQRLGSGSKDGSLRIWDVKSGREMGRCYGLDNGRDWLSVTPDGYFTGSEGGRQMVSWRIGNEYFPLELYESQFQKPEQVARSLRGSGVAGNMEVVAAPTAPVGAPPKVQLKVEKLDDQTVTVRVEAVASGPRVSIATIRLTVDGREIAPERSRNIVRQGTEAASVFQAVVDFPPNKDSATIAAVARDSQGLDSETGTLMVSRPSVKTAVPARLFVLTVGVSRYLFPEYNLDSADKDAKALAEALAAQRGKAFVDVQTRVLTDSDATSTAVREGLAWLKSSCTPADVAMVLFSGHGIRGNLGRLYYFTHEGDLDALKATCVDWSEIAQTLRDVRAQQIVFLADCCHAGAFGERSASQDELTRGFAKDAGVMVFASSRGNEKSLEHPDWGHGAFTLAILDGIVRGKADLIPDGKISISELQTYVAERVRQLTGDRQHPHLPRLENFDPGLIIATK